MSVLLVLFVLTVFAALLSGYPVAFVLAGVSLLFAALGAALGVFDSSFLSALPNRIWGVMNNVTLMAVPLFVFMGAVLERSGVAEELLGTLSKAFGRLRGGLAFAVLTVGTLLAASTGIVGATVVTMGLLSLPAMLRRGYDPALACGTLCAAGTLGQIIPPSIILVLLGDVLASAYQEAQLARGVFAPDTVSVGDLFVGALFPGLLLVTLYAVYIALVAWLRPQALPAEAGGETTEGAPGLGALLHAAAAPLVLIVAVLGSIMLGWATPTEAAGVGAAGAVLLAALRGRLNVSLLREAAECTLNTSSMVFMILIGAAFFSLVFRGFGGEALVHEALTGLPGGRTGALLVVMLVLFLLGFVLDFIEITFIVLPMVAPALFALGVDPVWLGVMVAMNLQTSFLTPPFGFALFYLRGVAPAEVRTAQIYRGVMPFIAIQLLALLLLAAWPALATWLPARVYGP